MNRRQFIKRGALFVPSIFVPRLIRAQSFSPHDPAMYSLHGAAAAGASFAYTAATLNGSNQYFNRGANFTSIADSKLGMVSFWINFNASSDGNFLPIVYGDGTHRIFKQGDVLSVQFNNGSTYQVNATTGSNTYTSANGWIHFISAWDASDVTKTKIYVNGSDVTSAGGQTNSNIDYTEPSDWGVCALAGGGIPFACCISELYFAAGQWLDLTNSANVQKFRTAGGKPVSLGSDGSTPTGSAPTLYFHVYTGTNAGTGGNLTLNNGPLTACTAP
jgi:hypothetical protein